MYLAAGPSLTRLLAARGIEGETRPREARWVMARLSFGPFEAGMVAANDEDDEASRLLWPQSPDPLA